MGRPPASGEAKARIDERRALVETLLLARTSYRRMIPLLQAEGYEASLTTIHSDVKVIREQHKRRIFDSPFGEHVAEQMAYYDAILRSVLPRALAGNARSLDHLLGVLDRRARLIGMDQPDKVLVAALHDNEAQTPEVIDVGERDARTERIMSILDEAGVFSYDDDQQDQPAGVALDVIGRETG